MSEDLISSLYTPPPLFYKYFTDDNVEKVAQGSQEGELKFLIPPAKPPGTHYRGYGNIWSFEDKLPKLSEMGYTQLYEDTNQTQNSQVKINELHKLLKSLLVNFIELIGVMTKNPEDFHVKIEDLKVVLININHILNSYRPHQSRELLIMLIKSRIEEKRGEIARIEQVLGSIKESLGTILTKREILDEKVEEDVGGLDVEGIREEIVERLIGEI